MKVFTHNFRAWSKTLLNLDILKDIDDFQPHQVNKKKAVYARHKGMRQKNIPTINTNGLRIKELYDLNSKEFNLKEEEGISSRLKKIWVF